MKKLELSVVVAAALIATSAIAADVPVKAKRMAAPPPSTPVFDVAFGAWVGSDYNFRGISQSNREWSAGAYIEPQLNTPIGQLYLGAAVARIEWPFAIGFTDPSAEVDFYGGWRNSWGPFSLDLGGIYYYYPGETFNGFTTKSDFYEIYAKAGYAITSSLSVGANIFYTPDLLHYSTSIASPASGGTGKPEGIYASLTAKWVTPLTFGEVGTYLSGELGHWWIDDAPFRTAGYTSDPSYTYWNIGAALTYKVFTLDFRYHGNDLSTAECTTFLFSAVGNASNKWCKDAYIATLKIDSSLSALGIVR